MSHISVRPDQSSDDEVEALDNLASLPISGAGEFIRKTGASTFENAVPADIIGAVSSVNGQTGAIVLDTGDISSVFNSRYVTDADLTNLGNLSGTNTGDQDLSTYVTKVGTPANNQIGVWTGDGTIEGDSAFTFDTSTDTLSVENITLTRIAEANGSFDFHNVGGNLSGFLNFGSLTSSDKTFTFPDASGTIALTSDLFSEDHGDLTGLADDDHTQYALLAGRSGGQTLIGGTASGNGLTLQSTSNATKGKILFGTSAYDEVNNRLGIGTASPGFKMVVENTINASVSPVLMVDNLGSGNFVIGMKNSGTGNMNFGFYDDANNVTAAFGYNISTLALQFVNVSYSGNFPGYRFNNDGSITYQDGATGNELMRWNISGNFLIGTTAAGTSAANVIGIKNGTAPSTSPADMIQIFSTDLSAGNATLGLRTETAVVTEAVTSDRTLSVLINGTVYKILLKV